MVPNACWLEGEVGGRTDAHNVHGSRRRFKMFRMAGEKNVSHRLGFFAALVVSSSRHMNSWGPTAVAHCASVGMRLLAMSR